MALLRAGLLLLVLLPLAAAAAPRASVPVRPPPAWVEPLRVDTQRRGLEAEASNGEHFILVDRQTRVGGPLGEERYVHQATRVTTEAGTQSVSDLRINFDPTFQRLTLHGVWLHRGGERRDLLQPHLVRVIQQEQGLEEQLYDGRLTALYFVPDVRVGDVVEYAFTLVGDNPVFGGRYSASFSAQYGVPVEHLHERLLWPARRELVVRPHRTGVQPRVREARGTREYVWEQHDVAALAPDDRLPASFDPWPWVQLSEYRDWGAVVDWALPLYARPARLSPALAREAARLRAAGASPGARMLAALRFVQDEVRYLGIELGASSFRPHAPDEVLAQRFGDCKDKALLLVTLLGALGVEAHPALVSTRLHAGVDAWHPTPYAFDHVIVRARVDGRELWVDPTRSLERGGLAELQPPPFARALVIAPGSRALVPIPAPTAETPVMEVEETYREATAGGPVTLDVTTVYRGREADRMRHRLATNSRADLARDYLQYYARTDASLQSTGPLGVKDDPAANVLTVQERYRLEAGFWSEGERTFRSAYVRDQLDRPRAKRRTMPLAHAHPFHVRHRIRLHPAEPVRVDTGTYVADGPAFRVETAAAQDGGAVVLDYSYRSLASEVPVEKVEAHLAALKRADELAADTVRRGAAPAAAPEEKDAALRGPLLVAAVLLMLLSGVGLFALVGGVVWLGVRHFDRAAPAAQPPALSTLHHGPAGAPVLPAEQVPEHLAQRTCRCGQAGVHHPHQQVGPFQGRLLTRVSWTCAGCGEPQRLFIEVQDTSRAA